MYIFNLEAVVLVVGESEGTVIPLVVGNAALQFE